MTSRLWLPGALLLVSTAPLCSQSQTPNTVQPGAPGQATKSLPAASAAAATDIRKPSPADISFMQGMVMHHNQAVEMTDLLKTRSQSPEVREIGNRINISQSDEMRFMKQWLADRGIAQPAPMKMDDMAGMDMSHMDHGDMAGMDMAHDNHKMADMDMPAMPGMLTPAQMSALRAAKGAEFDHLFLTGMIQHHTGALTMVKTLLATPGAAQDPVLFDFVSDVDNTQLAEIDFMKAMLQKEKQ